VFDDWIAVGDDAGCPLTVLLLWPASDRGWRQGLVPGTKWAGGLGVSVEVTGTPSPPRCNEDPASRKRIVVDGGAF